MMLSLGRRLTIDDTSMRAERATTRLGVFSSVCSLQKRERKGREGFTKPGRAEAIELQRKRIKVSVSGTQTPLSRMQMSIPMRLRNPIPVYISERA